MGFAIILFLIFLVLKILGFIDWSWWLVVSPLLINLIVSPSNNVIYCTEINKMRYLTDQDPEYWERTEEYTYRVYPDLRPEYSEPAYKHAFINTGLLTQYPPYSLTPKTETKTEVKTDG